MAYGSYRGWAPYVPVAARRRRAAAKVSALRKKGKIIRPVETVGRRITTSFWGAAWCENLESYSDYENRLPRGRTYVRNGSVVHLEIERGKIHSLVAGSSLYSVEVSIKPLRKKLFKTLAGLCAGRIDSVVELLEGKLSRGVMELLARRGQGLFPEPREISFECSCPDWAYLCKHVCATLYGVGARLDDDPEALFVLRSVDHTQLISAARPAKTLGGLAGNGKDKVLETSDLAGVFGIEFEEPVPSRTTKTARPPRATRRRKTKTAAAENGKARRRSSASAAQRRSSAARRRTTRSGVRITAQELIERGVPRTTFQNWMTTGVLRRTRQRGVYKTTASTEERIARALGTSSRR